MPKTASPVSSARNLAPDRRLQADVADPSAIAGPDADRHIPPPAKTLTRVGRCVQHCVRCVAAAEIAGPQEPCKRLENTFNLMILYNFTK